jgi:hypothetical protein
MRSGHRRGRVRAALRGRREIGAQMTEVIIPCHRVIRETSSEIIVETPVRKRAIVGLEMSARASARGRETDRFSPALPNERTRLI